MLRSVTISNRTGRNLQDCRLEISSFPAFLKPKAWVLDRVLNDDEIAISDRRIELDAAYLEGLNEAERGEISLTFSCRGETLAEIRQEVRLLARDEWGGVADMAQLLPAFVMPNDPAVAAILRKAGEKLASAGHPPDLNGYQSGDPRRSFMLSAAIYSSIVSMSLFYAEPPASFERRGQKVRRPDTIATDRLATCLDSTLLFAAALEAAGLNPAILMFDGHAAAGVWIVEKYFQQAVETDLVDVRKAMAAREFIAFETTGVCHRPPMAFDAARKAIEHRLTDEEAGGFVSAIDVRKARSAGIMPLASHKPVSAGDRGVAEEADVWVPMPKAPGIGDLPVELVEVKPTTAAGRIDRWQRKLLDLTLRNRLLNLGDTRKVIPFLCTDVGYLEDRLADGGPIRVVSLPEQNPLGERDPGLYREVHGRDIQRNYAAEALLRGELPSTLTSKELEARLIELHRQVRNDFSEGGTNTLFLAVGFLKWKKKQKDERIYRAPLLLVPVKLERRSASSSFSLRYHEDEPRFNATLLQFLEQEFDLKIPELSGDLPTDESGIDVPHVLSRMRHAVRDVPGMEVVDEAALSTFSFAKFLMWKDLVERTDALRQNRVVRHLIDTPDKPFADGDAASIVEGKDLDKSYVPSDIVSLLPADSSQIAASLAAAQGKDFVIVGPPGTGKSQTIANMIANCLANGKTVLFVAEKTAALDVVYRRLKEHGLGEQCLELHSNKADRKQFLSQLKASWEAHTATNEEEWIIVNEKLRVRRDELNAYVEALHHLHSNGWSAYYGIGIALRGRERFAPELAWPSFNSHDKSQIREMEALVDEMAVAFAAVRFRPVLQMVDVPQWTNGWQENIVAAAVRLEGAAGKLVTAVEGFLQGLGLPTEGDAGAAELNLLVRLAEALVASEGYDTRIGFEKDFSALQEAIGPYVQQVETYRSARDRLSAVYDFAALDTLDLRETEGLWRKASANFWPLSALGKSKIRKLLQGYATSGKVDPDTDIPLLRTIADCRRKLDENALKGRAIGAAGFDVDLGRLQETLNMAQEIRAAVRLPGYAADQLKQLLRTVAPVLPAPPQNDVIRPAARQFLSAMEVFEHDRLAFSQLAGKAAELGPGTERLSTLRAALTELKDARALLRDWAVWCGLRQRAMVLGLDPLVESLEQDLVPSDQIKEVFRIAYARWWLPRVLDADPALREFRRFRHENTVATFRELDDLVRVHASQRVRHAIAHGLPPVQGVPRQSELGLLRHQMDLQRPRKSIREMIAAMPETFSKLAPCMLMSPLSIAQYLPPDKALFDVVIFDEASQITTWDAVGAIARARQTIIVGDPKQLPPTNFFGRNDGNDGDGVPEFEADLESILDEAKAAGIPMRDLRWHYRSQSESLIAFSNYHYYQNRLVTFPAPAVDDRAVQLSKVPEGIYDRGKSRTNRLEAEKVAEEAVARMRASLAMPEKKRPTIGIVTFNAQQQSLIMDILDQARRNHPEIEWFFSDDRYEPTIVRNLENVQGDERDIILFSITFTQDAAGRRTMDFGALNRDGGERRLNVAVTRARQELIVFSGFTADQIDVGRTRALGVHHLKTFLDYAERGAIALPAADQGSVGGFDSPFEEAVAAELQARGWQIVPQVGISGFRIDIGVRHPDLPGRFLAGVECDGATYHSSATARDRDKVREAVLRNLGWDILRVWSTDWWFDPQDCADQLHVALNACLEESRKSIEEAAGAAQKVPAEPAVLTLPVEESGITDDNPEDSEHPVTGDVVEDVSGTKKGSAVSSVLAASGVYRAADLSGFNPAPDMFYDLAYRDTLQSIVDAVIEAEAPLRTDILAQKVSRAHGWLRTGGRIRERIDSHLKHAERTFESSGEFLWKTGTVARLLPYRHSETADTKRQIPEIPLAELAWIPVSQPAILETSDPALEIARAIGVDRLSAPARSRIDEALARARECLEQSSASGDGP